MNENQPAAYRRIRHLIERDQCVILDGGIATELERRRPKGYRIADQQLWGTWALYHAPYAVLDVHRAYAAVGCDVISTDAWGMLGWPGPADPGPPGGAEWRRRADVARLGVRLARQAVREAGKADESAVAFA